VIYNQGDYVCTGCGLVVGKVFEDMEWQNNAEDGIDNSRVGAPITSNTSHYTMIAGNGPMANSLRRTQQWAMAANDLQISGDNKKIDDKSSGLRLPSVVVDTAKELFKTAIEKRVFRGDVRNALMAVCIYYASKIEGQVGVGRSVEEVAIKFDCSIRHFHDAKDKLMESIANTKMFTKISSLELVRQDTLCRKVNFLSACSDPSVRWRVIKSARKLDDFLSKNGIGQSQNPEMFMAAIIWVACQIQCVNIPKKDFCYRCGLSQGTLSKHSSIISDALDTNRKLKTKI
jgi:transcription initiation factor TFIIIB Brf1 subunit/transcription initiation factor TFIIB